MNSLPLISNRLFLAAIRRDPRPGSSARGGEPAATGSKAPARAVPLEVLYGSHAVSAAAAARPLRAHSNMGRG